MALDVPVFSKTQVRFLLFNAGLDPDDLSEDNLAKIGVTSTTMQRAKVLAAYEQVQDVDAIADMLGGAIPKSSIRAYLCQADPNGPWRQRRRRSDAGSSSNLPTKGRG